MSSHNVVYIISDQHRYDFMGYETNGVTHTPNLDALGKRGTIFRTIVCPAPLCSPSRAALAAGRHDLLTQLYARINQNQQPRPNKSRGVYRPIRSDEICNLQFLICNF